MWDPIAEVPLDEYGRYVPDIWRLLQEHAAVDAVEAELGRICTESMGLDRGDNTDAAQRLVDWWYWRFDHPARLDAEDGELT